MPAHMRKKAKNAEEEGTREAWITRLGRKNVKLSCCTVSMFLCPARQGYANTCVVVVVVVVYHYDLVHGHKARHISC